MTDSIAKAYFELLDFEFDGDLIIRGFVKFFCNRNNERCQRFKITFGDDYCL